MRAMICVFLGPTLASRDARLVLEADYRPPAAQGDVFRAVDHGAVAIGIIDGYFQRIASVWHKEILWAMKQGVHMFGSASMGALRAAELHGFGMRGVGQIFADYRDGVLVDDDEVAVLHGPAEADYVAVSEAMVNIRATLAAAQKNVLPRISFTLVSSSHVKACIISSTLSLASLKTIPKPVWSS